MLVYLFNISFLINQILVLLFLLLVISQFGVESWSLGSDCFSC